MQKTESAGGVVINKAGQVLVVNQNHNSWSLPKGHLDPGETPLQAATREIYEESGIKALALIKALGSYERYRIGHDGGEDRSELKTIHMFLFSTNEDKLVPQDPDNPEARWVNPNQVVHLLTHPKDKTFIKSVLHLLITATNLC